MKIYHAGDTNVFGDMRSFTTSMRPTSPCFPSAITTPWSPREAAYACNLLRPKTVIPMHFGTFPLLDRNSGPIAEAGPGRRSYRNETR